MDSAFLYESFGIALLASVGAFFLTGLCLSVAWPSFHARQSQLSPRQYSRVIFGYASLPLIVAIAIFVSCSAVPIAAGFNVVPNHCHVEMAFGSCLPHEPSSAAGLWFVLFYAITIALCGGVAALMCWRLYLHSKVCRQLDLCCTYTEHLDAWVLETDKAAAFCVGILKRRIIVSQGLVETLDQQQLDIVLYHERSHAKRFDGIGMFLLQILIVPFSTNSRQGLTDEFLIAAEFACDRYAAERCGDRLAVADTLVNLGRIQVNERRTMSNDCWSFAVFDQSIERRVLWLLDMPGPGEQGLSALIERSICYTIVIAFVIAEPVHQALEKALGYLSS